MKRSVPISVILSCLLFAACGDAGDLAATSDTSVFDGTTVDTVGDAQSSDTSTPETIFDTTPSDASEETANEVREVEGPLTGLKDDPTYLVPGNVATKTDVSAAGDLVAWVESSGDDAPYLVVWNIATPDIGPRAFNPPNLAHPRALALSDAYLAYVDDRYGDPDVFAIDLANGREVVVVNRAGAQEAPAIYGSRVAWEDCSTCVTGDGIPGHEPRREVIERDLAGGAEIARSSDGVADRAPSYGLLADGRPALAWLSGRTTLRMERLEAGVSATLDMSPHIRIEQQLARVAVWNGRLAWRPNPLIVNPDSMIVNPDSMYPSDVFATDPSDGATVALTLHAELAARMDIAPLAFGPRLAWLQIPAGIPATGRIMLASSPVGESAPAMVAEANGLTTFAMGRDFIVFSAPRVDNDGAEDVHVLRLALP